MSICLRVGRIHAWYYEFYANWMVQPRLVGSMVVGGSMASSKDVLVVPSVQDGVPSVVPNGVRGDASVPHVPHGVPSAPARRSPSLPPQPRRRLRLKPPLLRCHSGEMDRKDRTLWQLHQLAPQSLRGQDSHSHQNPTEHARPILGSPHQVHNHNPTLPLLDSTMHTLPLHQVHPHNEEGCLAALLLCLWGRFFGNDTSFLPIFHLSFMFCALGILLCRQLVIAIGLGFFSNSSHLFSRCWWCLILSAFRCFSDFLLLTWFFAHCSHLIVGRHRHLCCCAFLGISSQVVNIISTHQTHERQGKCQVNLHGVETVSLTVALSSSKGLGQKTSEIHDFKYLLFIFGKKLTNHKIPTLQLNNSFHVQFRSSMTQPGKTGWLAASAKILMYLQQDFLFVSLYKCSSQILYKQLKGDFLSRHLGGCVCTDLSRTPRV